MNTLDVGFTLSIIIFNMALILYICVFGNNLKDES